MKPFIVIVHPCKDWGPEQVEREGLTGAEEVVVYLSEALARIGYRVAVSIPDQGGRPDRIVSGVRWTDTSYLARHHENDPLGENTVLVSSFVPNVPPPPFRARVKLFWAHSIGFDDVRSETWDLFDHAVCATAWQADTFVSRYPRSKSSYKRDGCKIIPYGINPPPVLPKVPGKCLYASSPDRGLFRLLRWWPAVRAACPDLTLYVAYGRDRMRDRAKSDPAFAADIAEIDRLLAENRDSVTDLGFVSKPEMDRHLGEAEFWLYPTDFEETGCLIGRRAMLSGCVPVASGAGCLPEILSAEGRAPFWDETRTIDSADAMRALVRHIIANSPRAPHGENSWPSVATAWDKLLDPQPSPA